MSWILIAAFVLTFLALASDALAYIDPGAGSSAYQLLLAVAIGAGFYLRLVWKRLFDRRKGNGSSDQSTTLSK